jgi:hypothetical protein
MFSCITGASSHKLLHFLDALDLRRIQMIICHAIRLSHETHVHWFILAMLAVRPIPIETHDVPLYLNVRTLSIISTDTRFSSYLCSFHGPQPDAGQSDFQYLLLGQYSHFQTQYLSLADPKREQCHLFRNLCPTGDQTKKRSPVKKAQSSDKAKSRGYTLLGTFAI